MLMLFFSLQGTARATVIRTAPRMWTIFKDLIEFVTILLLFRVYFFLFGPKACRILGP